MLDLFKQFYSAAIWLGDQESHNRTLTPAGQKSSLQSSADSGLRPWLQRPEWCLMFRRVWVQPVGRPASAAAPWPSPVGHCWPGTRPADRFGLAAWRQASPSSTWWGRGRPGRTRCGRHAASPAGWRCGGASGRAAGEQAPPQKAAGTARGAEGRTGSLLGEGHKVTHWLLDITCSFLKGCLTSWRNDTFW